MHRQRGCPEAWETQHASHEVDAAEEEELRRLERGTPADSTTASPAQATPGVERGEAVARSAGEEASPGSPSSVPTQPAFTNSR